MPHAPLQVSFGCVSVNKRRSVLSNASVNPQLAGGTNRLHLSQCAFARRWRMFAGGTDVCNTLICAASSVPQALLFKQTSLGFTAQIRTFFSHMKRLQD